ncbi:MAG TPA: hypothetical protein VF121_09000 [Thermoanaerobaculia bacterium]|nr:hypothetical protein [Thermoanaerobaculia bacterium]
MKGIEEAVAALRRDPDQPVTAEIDGLVLELRHKGDSRRARRTADDVFSEVGSWGGETYEEMTKLLRESRKQGGSKEPPVF